MRLYFVNVSKEFCPNGVTDIVWKMTNSYRLIVCSLKEKEFEHFVLFFAGDFAYDLYFVSRLFLFFIFILTITQQFITTCTHTHTHTHTHTLHNLEQTDTDTMCFMNFIKTKVRRICLIIDYKIRGCTLTVWQFRFSLWQSEVVIWVWQFGDWILTVWQLWLCLSWQLGVVFWLCDSWGCTLYGS